MYYPKLDHPERCRHCLSCVDNCPVDAIEYEDDSFHVDAERCLKGEECLLCIETCPTGAIIPHKTKQD